MLFTDIIYPCQQFALLIRFLTLKKEYCYVLLSLEIVCCYNQVPKLIRRMDITFLFFLFLLLWYNLHIKMT